MSQTLDSTLAPSTYYTDIIRRNFKQIQEAYFGTKNLAKEDQSEIQIKAYVTAWETLKR